MIAVKYKSNVNCNDKDILYHDLVFGVSDKYLCKLFYIETPLFIFYSSGSTGKLKGALYTLDGYLLYVIMVYIRVGWAIWK